MLKGLTVQYLLRQTYELKGGETILFHAAAGMMRRRHRAVGEHASWKTAVLR